ncbi:MAG: TIGR02206 family membrane protein [Candidatus Nomurabacteria bacterium]
MEHTVIQIFSNQWWIYTSITCFLIVFALLISKKIKKDNLVKYFKYFGYLILIQILFTQIYLFYVHQTWSFENSLPLSLCRASIIFAALALINKKIFFVEWSVYLGISGGIQSILTPDLSFGNTSYIIFDYYFVHGLLLFVPIFLIYIYKFKLEKFSSLKAILYGNIMMLIVFPLNYIFNSNYMYLKIKPTVSNPLLFGGWPWYIFGFEIVGIVSILIMDCVFRLIPKYLKL